MKGGWIPAWRTLFERSDWLRPTPTRPACFAYAWLDLCQLAQHDDYDHAGERLQRGEVMVSVRSFAARWCWSKSSVGRFLSRLETGTMIGTVRGTPHGTVYHIVNYDTYASPDNGQRDTRRDRQWDRGGTPAGQEQQQTTNKKAYTSDFEALWQVSRRGSKRAAFEQYRKAVPKKVDHPTLMATRRAHVTAAREEQFIKHLERWIRDERWLEEVGPTEKSGALARGRL